MRVLIFAPEPEAAMHLHFRLQRLGHGMIQAKTPNEACELLARERPDVLVVVHPTQAYPECQMQRLLDEAANAGVGTLIEFASRSDLLSKPTLKADAYSMRRMCWRELDF